MESVGGFPRSIVRWGRMRSYSSSIVYVYAIVKCKTGKTTLLRYVLENSKEKIACIVNDVAAINIDAKLVRNDKNRGSSATTADLTDTIELANGCACACRAGSFLGSRDVLHLANYGPDFVALSMASGWVQSRQGRGWRRGAGGGGRRGRGRPCHAALVSSRWPHAGCIPWRRLQHPGRAVWLVRAGAGAGGQARGALRQVGGVCLGGLEGFGGNGDCLFFW